MQTSRFTAFQRLALATTAITYVLILVGGLVRASGAGLGCPDWPRCFGTWVPPLSAASLPPEFDRGDFNATLMWTEYLNRLLGVAVGLSILATMISAWRHHRREPHILGPVAAALLLTAYQGWLGGRVVAHELAPWIVTVHLVVALIIVSLLLYATVSSFFVRQGIERNMPPERRVLLGTTAMVIVVTLCQVAIGTRVRGHVDLALDRETPRAAALSAAGAWDQWHRDTALAVVGGTLVLLALARRGAPHHQPLLAAAWVAAALAVMQVAVGLILAYAALPPAAQVAHLFIGSLLLGAQTVLFLLARWLSPRDATGLLSNVRESNPVA